MVFQVLKLEHSQSLKSYENHSLDCGAVARLACESVYCFMSWVCDVLPDVDIKRSEGSHCVAAIGMGHVKKIAAAISAIVAIDASAPSSIAAISTALIHCSILRWSS